MKKFINYDFSEFINIMFSLKQKQDQFTLSKLKKELNKFFKDSNCKDILYTRNTDKVFFGMRVIPDISGDMAVNILQTDSPVRITDYYLEIDSKLFDLQLSSEELVAILLHEVGHLVNDSTPVDNVRKTIDLQLAKGRETLSISDSVNYRSLLAFAIKDTIRRYASIFEKNPDEEILADEFVFKCGFGDQLQSALKTVLKNTGKLTKGVDNKLIVLTWTLRLYKDVKFKRIAAIKSLKKAKSLSGSELEKREYDSVIRKLERIDDATLMESAFDDLKNKYMKKIDDMKYRGVKGLKSDLYELTMRAKNVDTSDEALLILRSINSNMSIIEDYLDNDKVEPERREEFFDVLEKYQDLRDHLVNKTLYKEKQLLNITYPEIRQKY